jgi:GIY-YIG catalytic domain
VRLEKLTDANVCVLPHRPGLYFFFDEGARLIYVGKAKRLKARLNEHLEGYNRLKCLRENGRSHLLPILSLQIVDFALDRAKYFAVRFISEDKIAEEEFRYIAIFQPCFNYQTFSLEYQRVQRGMIAESKRPEDEELLKQVINA